jgi:ATP-dependent Clp protease ATP-binding subunit ClpA
VACGADVSALKRQLEEVLAKAFTPVPPSRPSSRNRRSASTRVMQQAMMHAAMSSAKHVDSGSLLVFILREEESHAAYYLRAQGSIG